MLTAVTDVPPQSTLRDVSVDDYIIPRTRLKFGAKAFSISPSSPSGGSKGGQRGGVLLAASSMLGGSPPEHGTGSQQNSS